MIKLNGDESCDKDFGDDDQDRSNTRKSALKSPNQKHKDRRSTSKRKYGMS